MSTGAPPQAPAPSSSASSASASANMISPEPSSAATRTAAEPPSRPRYKHSHSSSTSSRRRVPRSDSSDFLSDRATSQLIRRVLCPQQVPDRGRTTPPPIDELLPPLTSRNDVDLQLYAIIAIVLRDFVQTWYSKITPDEAFVAEIVQVIAHCTRALEQRLRKVDVESLLFDELPDLLDKHVQAYRASRRPLVRPPIEADGREIYHSLCPLPYLSPIPRIDRPETTSKQAANEVAYRQLLVQGVLAVLLPTEDLENECLTSLVGQILSELIIGGVVVKKASEPWMIWTGLTILADVIARRRQQSLSVSSSSSFSSGPALEPAGRSPLGVRGFSIPGLLWSFVHYMFALAGFVRALFAMLAMGRSLPPRGHQLSPQKDDGARHDEQDDDDVETATKGIGSAQLKPSSAKTPILAFAIWPMISGLIGMDRRMPWLSGSLSMLQWLAIGGPGHVAGPDGIIDRLLSDAIHRHVLDPGMLPMALRNLRGAIFPNNAMGSPTLFPPESDHEVLALRRRCASALRTLVPKSVGGLYFGGNASSWLAACFTSESPPPEASLRTDPIGTGDRGNSGHGLRDEGPDAHIIAAIETDILDVFSDSYCNKHLMYSALELVLVRLIPELAEKGVEELLEERLS